MEVECYRFFGHARKDKSPYRTEQEEEESRQFDPVKHAKEKLLSESLLNEDDIKDIDKTVDIEMDVSMNYAIKSPLNDESEIFTDVYDQSYKIESVDSRIKNILKK